MFRINLYLQIDKFLKGLFSFYKTNYLCDCSKILKKQSKKKNIFFTSQCRIAFLYILKFLKIINPKKKEIVFVAYNLPEMVNVAKNLNYKIKYCDIDIKTGFYNFKNLKKIISNKTQAIVLTNMFNNYQDSIKLKNLAKKNRITIIEDNAIYFDNYFKTKTEKKFTGSIGDFSIYSFNIMKNISALYGGAVASNNKQFNKFISNENKKLNKFPRSKILVQTFIFFILKIMSVRILYNNFFLNVIKQVHKNDVWFILKLFYPSLKFKIIDFPKFYFTKISNLSIKLINFQLMDTKKRSEDFYERKKRNIYYFKKLKQIQNKNIKLINIKDFNFQNFIDFPILVKNKKNLNNYLLKNGIELRYYHYRDCSTIMRDKNSKKMNNSQIFEKEILCLPNHKRITFNYIDKILSRINHFYLKKKA